jgi:hypothetical protein
MSSTRAIELALIKSVSRFSIIYYYRRILIRNNLDCWLVTKQPRGLYIKRFGLYLKNKTRLGISALSIDSEPSTCYQAKSTQNLAILRIKLKVEYTKSAHLHTTACKKYVAKQDENTVPLNASENRRQV